MNTHDDRDAPLENALQVLERQLIAERHRSTMLQSLLQQEPTLTQKVTSESRAQRLLIRFASRKRSLIYAAGLTGLLLLTNVIIAAATAAIVVKLAV